jgi:3-phosphoshikimate 1-carboxyvinyltransferase
MGAKISGSSVQTVESNGFPRVPRKVIDCGESGVTLRFVVPILALSGTAARLTARDSLLRRPIEPLANALKQIGVELIVKNGMISLTGSPQDGGTVTVSGDVSSQFISGLLFAGFLMKNGLTLELTSKLESRNYVLLTVEILRRHGAKIRMNKSLTQFQVLGGQSLFPASHKISGDFSAASYFLSAAAITGSTLTVDNLQQTIEPDSVFVEILERMGIPTCVKDNEVIVKRGELTATEVDVSECPDLGPIIAVLACFAEGKTTITGARRLRYKESDRLSSIRSELLSLGADITETEDGLILNGPVNLRGGTVKSHNDHRIAMALSIAALGGREDVVIEGAECVNKSYPRFFDDYRSLGVEAIE